MPQDLVDQNTQVRISIEAETATGPATLSPSVFAEVMSVEMSPDSSDITLQIEDYGAMNSMEVTVLR
jgi:flagellar basal-body rod modification protein FlgD